MVSDVLPAPAEGALRRLVEEAFPSIESVYREPWRVPPEGGLRGDFYLWTHLFRSIRRSESWDATISALGADPVLGPAANGQDMYVSEPMGSGGVLQLEVLPSNIIEEQRPYRFSALVKTLRLTVCRIARRRM